MPRRFRPRLPACVLTCSLAFAACGDPADTTCEGVADGTVERRTRFESGSVGSGGTCRSEEQTRTCTTGTFSAWSGTFTFEACAVLGAPCDGEPDGTVQSRTAYASADVAYDETCTSEAQTRTCNDGTWGAWSGTLSFEACAPREARSCDGVPHGEQASRTRYQAGSVPFGSECVGETQTGTCIDGMVEMWTGTYEVTRCGVEPGRSCGDLAHDETRVVWRYPSSTVPFGDTCEAQSGTEHCYDGTLNVEDLPQGYIHETCTAEEPACTASDFHYLRADFESAATGPVGLRGAFHGEPQSLAPGLTAEVVNDGITGKGLRVTSTQGLNSTRAIVFGLLGERELRQGQRIEVGLRIRVEAIADTLGLLLREAGGATTAFSDINLQTTGTMHWYDPNGFRLNAATYATNQSLAFRWVYDIPAGTYSVQLNGNTIIDRRAIPAQLAPTERGIGGVYLNMLGTEANPTTVVVDDVEVIHQCTAAD